jgi:hypothetical protein
MLSAIQPAIPATTLATLATAAVSEGHVLDVATEVWRTGELPALPYAGARGRRAATARTAIDLFGGDPPPGVPVERLSYRHRQQAGLDALIALATPPMAEGSAGGASGGF